MTVASTRSPVARDFIWSRRRWRSTSSGTGASWGGGTLRSVPSIMALLPNRDASGIENRGGGVVRNIHVHDHLAAAYLQRRDHHEPAHSTVCANAAAHGGRGGAIALADGLP